MGAVNGDPQQASRTGPDAAVVTWSLLVSTVVLLVASAVSDMRLVLMKVAAEHRRSVSTVYRLRPACDLFVPGLSCNLHLYV